MTRSHQRVATLFRRNLGVTWVLAFRSLRRQVPGLYGSRGLTPLGQRLDQISRYESRPLGRLKQWPSLFWFFGASDRALVRLCRVGEAAGACLAAGILPRLAALTAWASYLSFVSIGWPFLSYQWDALLLESGLLSALTLTREPSWATVTSMRWLTARLHFESGFAKLQSKDETWRKFTAGAFHHMTQPLPTPLGWYANQLPARAHAASTFGVLAAETAIPPLSLLPGPLRRFAFVTMTSLQLAIAISGNYGFFNLLSAQLSLWLLDDRDLQKLKRRRHGPRQARAERGVARARRRWAREAFDAILLSPYLAASAGLVAQRFTRHTPPKQLESVLDIARRIEAVNPYGLFSVMTTERREIVISGSADGVSWQEIDLPFKPGALDVRPRFTLVHLPRLDWQLWFAALGRIEPWFATFLQRLLEGEPAVRELLGRNPFEKTPPRFVRADLYDYRMTSFEARRATGKWWTREKVGVLVPPVSLAPQ